ncbi:dihydrodipicolinate synthase family protein [Chelatococcus sp.]|uniref:dihydrodipicolinate synthase family protein n=1 Tax=Chelatococcus sp. TaxID=1953771 RepID=UPI0034500421
MTRIQKPAAPSDRPGAHPHPIGISAAMATPFNADLSIDTGLLAAHAARLLDEGCSSLTLFGTTGEGPSIATAERAAANRR